MLNVKQYEAGGGVMLAEATVFVSHGSLKYFVTRLEKYTDEEGHRPFVDPIREIGLATLENLWTVEKPLPSGGSKIWWELWVMGEDSE